MFPTIFATSLRGLGNKTKRASSVLMMSPVGGAVGTWLMGFAADWSGSMTVSFVVPFVAFLVVMAYALYVERLYRHY